MARTAVQQRPRTTPAKVVMPGLMPKLGRMPSPHLNSYKTRSMTQTLPWMETQYEEVFRLPSRYGAFNPNNPANKSDNMTSRKLDVPGNQFNRSTGLRSIPRAKTAHQSSFAPVNILDLNPTRHQALPSMKKHRRFPGIQFKPRPPDPLTVQPNSAELYLGPPSNCWGSPMKRVDWQYFSSDPPSAGNW